MHIYIYIYLENAHECKHYMHTLVCERERNAIRIITYSEMKLKSFRSASIRYEKLL